MRLKEKPSAGVLKIFLGSQKVAPPKGATFSTSGRWCASILYLQQLQLPGLLAENDKQEFRGKKLSFLKKHLISELPWNCAITELLLLCKIKKKILVFLRHLELKFSFLLLKPLPADTSFECSKTLTTTFSPLLP